MAKNKVLARNKAKLKVYLSEEEKKVLAGLLDEWNSKPDKNTRDSFVSSEALPKIQQLNMSKYGPEIISKDKEAKMVWEGRVKAVYTWFKNNKPYKDRAVFKLERKIPLRRVIGKLKADQIDEMVMSVAPDVEKGDKAYPGHFQKCLTALMKTLTAGELEEMERTREKWQNDGPPIDVRLNAAKKYSRKGIINAHQLLQKEMYVSCITFSFNPEADTGVMAVVCHDYIANLHAKSHGKMFKTFKEWNSQGYARIVQEMVGYANYVDEQRKEEGIHEPEAVPINFERGPGGLPLLPPEVKGVRGLEIAKNAQEIIRAYFLRHYQLATACESARTPWAVIGDNPSTFFDTACLPPMFKFRDPSRMGIMVKSLLSHLRERQKEHGVNAFNFHHVLRNNKLELAEYPAEAQAAIRGVPEGGDDMSGAEVAKSKSPIESAPAAKGSRSPVKTPRGKKSKKRRDQTDAVPDTPKSGSLESTTPISNNPRNDVTMFDIQAEATANTNATLEEKPQDRLGDTVTLTDIYKSPNPLQLPRNTANPPPLQVPIPISIPTTFSADSGPAGFQMNWPNPIPIPNSQNVQYGAYPPMISPQYMAYMLKHMADANPPQNGIGYHLGPGQPQGSFVNIDPQLPPGPPSFFNLSQPFPFMNQELNFSSHAATQQETVGFGYNPPAPAHPPAPATVSDTPKKTPKRKRSHERMEADVTPSRSNRKRKPTQKYLESLEMGNN